MVLRHPKRVNAECILIPARDESKDHAVERLETAFLPLFNDISVPVVVAVSRAADGSAPLSCPKGVIGASSGGEVSHAIWTTSAIFMLLLLEFPRSENFVPRWKNANSGLPELPTGIDMSGTRRRCIPGSGGVAGADRKLLESRRMGHYQSLPLRYGSMGHSDLPKRRFRGDLGSYVRQEENHPERLVFEAVRGYLEWGTRKRRNRDSWNSRLPMS